MRCALTTFETGLEEVQTLLISIAKDLDSFSADNDSVRLRAKLEETATRITDANSLLSARRIIFAHEVQTQ